VLISPITPYKVVQGHRRRDQPKDRMRLSINSNGHPISYRFEVIADAYCCFNFGHFEF